MNLSENEKRWVVTGVALNKVLLPELRSFVNQKVQNEYTKLVSSHSIHVQTAPGYGGRSLHYENINCNENYKFANGKYDKSKFNLKVANHVDLAKLYLLPFMAKFNTFDEHCDLSAVLILLGSVPAFSRPIQAAAKVLRDQVRNDWAHCNFTEWDAAKFQKSFKEMDALIQNLGLASGDEAKLLNELHDWETKGTTLCTNSPVDPQLLELVRNEMVQLKYDVEHYFLESEDKRMQIKQKLEEVEEHFQKEIEELKTRVNRVEGDMQEVKGDVQEMKDDMQEVKGDMQEVKGDMQEVKGDMQEVKGDMQEVKGDMQEVKGDVQEVKGDVQEVKGDMQEVKGDVQEMKDKIKKLGDNKEEASFIGENQHFIGIPDRNACFTGREKELATLNQNFLGNKTSPTDCVNVQHQLLAISGLGGGGKTATAIEFAWRARGYYRGGIFWLSGESDEMLSKSIRQLVEFLGDNMNLPLEKKEDAESIQKEGKDVNILTQKFNRVLMWLHKRPFPWLLVVDNTDHLELSPYMYELLRGTWKRESQGHILVTSRCNSEELQEVLQLQPTNVIILQPLTVSEAAEFLFKRIDVSLSEDVFSLADELGGLPLALEQAAGYIKVVKCTVKEYLEEYLEQRLKLLNKKESSPISDHFTKERLAIHTTWQVNIEHISKGGGDLCLGKAALLMIKICAFLFSDVIPIEVVNGGNPEVDDPDFCRFARKSLGQKQIINLMTKFSLFQTSPVLNSLSVHRLVQEIIRGRCEEDGTRDFVLSCAVRVLHKAFCDTFTAADLVCWLDRLDKWRTKNTATKPKELPNPSTGGLWLKLAMNSNCLRSYLVTFINEDNAKHLWFTKGTARLMRETALYFCHFRNFTESRYCYRAMLRILCGLKKCLDDSEFDTLTRNVCFNNTTDTDDFTCEFGSWCTSLTPVEELKDYISYTEQEAKNAFADGNFEQSCALIDLISPRTDTSELTNTATEVNFAKAYPKHATLYNYRSASLYKLEKYEEALNDVQKWLKCCPDLFIAQKRKVFVLCKLAKENMLRWRARARAAMALLLHMFGKDKGQKLEKRFPQILNNVLFVAVSSTEEWLSQDKNESGEIIYIFTGESYQIDTELVLRNGCVSFVGLPGKLVELHFNAVLVLSSAQDECIYLMENLHVAIKLGGFVCSKCVFQATECLFEQCKSSSSDQEFINKSIKSSLGDWEKSQKKLNTVALLSAYGMKEVFISNSIFAGLATNSISQLNGYFSGVLFTGSNVTLKGNIVNRFYCGCEISDCNNSVGNLVFGNCVLHCTVGIVGNYISNASFVGNTILYNTQGLILRSCNVAKVVENLISWNVNGIIVTSSNVRLENNILFSNFSWGVVITRKSNVEMKLNKITDNKCGGVRVLLNDSGVVTLQNNVMRNLGPSVCPVERPPYLEEQLMDCGSSNSCNQDNFGRYVDAFTKPLKLMKMTPANLSFNPPRLIDNLIANQHDFVELKGKTWLPELCCFCYSRLDENPFECERCLVSRYCGKQCYLKDEEHCKICKALLSIYTVEITTKTHLAKFCGKTVVLRQRFDPSDRGFEWQDSCGDVPFSSPLKTIQEQVIMLLVRFQNVFGFPEPSTMLQVIDSYVYARLENNGNTWRVYLHEPAPASLFDSP